MTPTPDHRMTTRRPSPPDAVLARIADYVTRHRITRQPAYAIARYCLLDALACSFEIRIDYPLGHPRRRGQGLALVEEKFRSSVARRFSRKQAQRIMAVCSDPQRLMALPVSRFMDHLTVE